MATPYISISALQQSTMLTTVNLGVNVNSLPNNTIRYAFDTLGVTNCSMSNLQATSGSFDYSGINNILDYASSNQMKVRIDSLLKDLPSWFTTMNDTPTILTTLNTHIQTVITYLKTNYNNIIEIDLINDVFDNSGYKTNFLNNALSGSNVVSTVFGTARSILGTSKVNLMYNHSNTEEAYDFTGSVSMCSTLRDFKTYRIPIDGISLNVNAHTNASFMKIENSIINIKNLNYRCISFNDVKYSIPTTTTENLEEQARFYKTLVEIGFNYSNINTISFAGLNDSDVTTASNSVLFSNNFPKIAYNNIIDLYKTFDPSWINIGYSRATNRDFFNNPIRLINSDVPPFLKYVQPIISGGAIISVNLSASSNIPIPNDFLGLSQSPCIIDTYIFKIRKSYVNLLNLFKYTKKSNMGMRFRCFAGISTGQTNVDNYRNKKTIERINMSKSIGAKCALQIGHGAINSSIKLPVTPTITEISPSPSPAPAPAVDWASIYNIADDLYNTNINNYVNTAKDIVDTMDPSIFETIEIFNEPQLIPAFGKITNTHGLEYYKRVYKSIIDELNKNPKIRDNIVLGSFAGGYSGNYYDMLDSDGTPIIDLTWLNGKIKAFSHHLYVVGGDEGGINKLCKIDPTDATKCLALNDNNNIILEGGIPKKLDYLTSSFLPTINGYKFKQGPVQLYNIMRSTDTNNWSPIITRINNNIVKPPTYTGNYPYGFHINETNSVYHSGQYGISDIFLSALWLIDFSLYNASYGARRMNLQGGNVPQGAYNMIDYPDVYDISVPFDTVINVKPLYYGYWFLHAAMRCGSGNTQSKIMDHYTNADKSLRIWKLNNGLETTFVVIYYTATTTNITCNIQAPDQTGAKSGKVIRLLSRDGDQGRHGITFGNLSLDGTSNGIPYNVRNNYRNLINLTEAGVDSALNYTSFTSTQASGKWSFNIPIKSPSAFILRC